MCDLVKSNESSSFHWETKIKLNGAPIFAFLSWSRVEVIVLEGPDSIRPAGRPAPAGGPRHGLAQDPVTFFCFTFCCFRGENSIFAALPPVA